MRAPDELHWGKRRKSKSIHQGREEGGRGHSHGPRSASAGPQRPRLPHLDVEDIDSPVAPAPTTGSNGEEALRREVCAILLAPRRLARRRVLSGEKKNLEKTADRPSEMGWPLTGNDGAPRQARGTEKGRRRTPPVPSSPETKNGYERERERDRERERQKSCKKVVVKRKEERRCRSQSRSIVTPPNSANRIQSTCRLFEPVGNPVTFLSLHGSPLPGERPLARISRSE